VFDTGKMVGWRLITDDLYKSIVIIFLNKRRGGRAAEVLRVMNME